MKMQARRSRGSRRLPAIGLAVALVGVSLAGVITGCGGKEVTQPPPPAQAPVVQVLAPNGGENFLAGTQTEITWTATDGDTPVLLITIEFSSDGGAIWLPVALGDPNNGTFTWAVPWMATGQALIRVTATDGVNRGSDVSDNPFSISATPPPPPDTPETLTAKGWTAFEAGSFALALQRFGAAVALDAQYGPAYTGRGWVELSRATTTDAFRAAVASFDAAVARGQTGADVRGGRAAAKLALGGSDLVGAVQEAREAVAASPTFVFPHRTSFDYRDLHLIAAFAEAGRGGRFSAARDEANQVQPSGITQEDSRTWTVDDVRYPTFEAAVAAWLHKMSAAFAG